MRYDSTKMRELVLYIARRQSTDSTFGRVKLAKLLYYSDCEAYRQLGSPITGADYQKLPHGPAARQFLPTFAGMRANSEAHEVRVGPGFRVVADRAPDPDVFEDDELRIVDEVLERFHRWTAIAMSRESHKEIGWRAAEPGEVIPFAAFLLAPEVTGVQRKRGAQLAEERGWVGEPF